MFVTINTRVNSYLLLQTVCSSMQDKSATKPSSGEMLWKQDHTYPPLKQMAGKRSMVSCSLFIWRKQQHQAASLNLLRPNVRSRGVKATVLVSTSDCLVLKLVFAWQTWTCAKVHTVHSWTQAMKLRTILTLTLIKWSQNNSYQFSYISRYNWPGCLWCLKPKSKQEV